jgi:hypothetical protein
MSPATDGEVSCGYVLDALGLDVTRIACNTLGTCNTGDGEVSCGYVLDALGLDVTRIA